MIDVKFITSLGDKQENGQEKQIYLEELSAAQVMNLITQPREDEYMDFRGGFAISHNEKPWNTPQGKFSSAYLYDDLQRTTQWLTALSDVVNEENQRTSFSWFDDEFTSIEMNKKNQLLIKHESEATRLRALKVDAKEFIGQMLKSSKRLNKFLNELSNRIQLKTKESPLQPVSKRLLEVKDRLENLDLNQKIKTLEKASKKLQQ